MIESKMARQQMQSPGRRPVVPLQKLIFGNILEEIGATHIKIEHRETVLPKEHIDRAAAGLRDMDMEHQVEAELFDLPIEQLLKGVGGDRQPRRSFQQSIVLIGGHASPALNEAWLVARWCCAV